MNQFKRQRKLASGATWVVMIGGGGRSCRRVDHGIAIISNNK